MSAIVAALQRLLRRYPPGAMPAREPHAALPWVLRSEAFAEDLGDAYRRA